MNDFRDDAQSDAVLRALEATLRRHRRARRRTDGTAYQVLDMVASEAGSGGLHRLFELAPAQVRAIGSLLVALASGPGDVDEWLDMYETKEPR